MGGLYSYWQGNGFPYLIKKVTHTGHFDNKKSFKKYE